MKIYNMYVVQSIEKKFKVEQHLTHTHIHTRRHTSTIYHYNIIWQISKYRYTANAIDIATTTRRKKEKKWLESMH